MNQPITSRVSPLTTPAGRQPAHRPHLPLAPWMPWIGRQRPATPDEEAAFADELARRAAGSEAPVRRSDVTAVLNALRCGLTAAELFEEAPGLRPERLHAAYCELEYLRFEASLAWSTIAASGHIEVFEDHRAAAAKLLPAVVSRLDDVARTAPEEFDLVALQLAAAVASTNAAARRIERVIAAAPAGSTRAVTLGRVLYDPCGGGGVTGRPDFLAHRVGALVPARVAALLGEPVAGESSVCTRGRVR